VQRHEGDSAAQHLYDPDVEEELNVTPRRSRVQIEHSSVMRGVRIPARLVLGVVLALFPSALSAQETGATVILRGTSTDNVYVAGGTVDVLADIERDLVGAGGTINIRQLVKGDVIVAGGSVNVSGRVGDDIRAAGGFITIGGSVGGEVVAAGGTVSLAPEARVEGRAWLSGGRVVMAGRIARELKVAAVSVSVAGEVDGDVRLAARAIEIGPTARIKGDLVYTSGKPARIDPGAQIQGRVTYTKSVLAARAARIGRLVVVLVRIVFLAGMIVCGVVLLLLFPGFAVSAARTIRSNPWKSLGLGFLVLIVTPIVGIILMITIIGIPLGLALGALYMVALLLGYLTAALFLGELGARLFGGGPEFPAGSRVLSLVLSLVVLALVRLIPVLGGIVALLAIVIGLGAASQHAFRRWAEARS
jgi:cytoskeletal protein CcmA (bactofilin family)